MTSKNSCFRFLAFVTIFCFFSATLLATTSKASFLESQMINKTGETVSLRDIDEIKVKRALEHKLVAEKLKSHGLSKEQVVLKKDKMSDEDIHQLASLSDKLPVGADSGVGFVIAVLVVIALVLAILYLWKRV